YTHFPGVLLQPLRHLTVSLLRYALQRGGTIVTGKQMVKQYLFVVCHLVIPRADRMNRRQIR
ncbi:hypothetical protein, partial [Yersinia enterocolitica]|uniref:hypothetical protein n=1 Tax=Yersinia enterocolitica TaxID=630 RepID=UPI001E3D9691